MRIKWMTSLIFCVFYQASLAQESKTASTLEVQFSMTDSSFKIQHDNPMFIDTFVNLVFIKLTTSNQALANSKVIVELKKKNKLAETLKPLWNDTCHLSSGFSSKAMTIPVGTTMTESGNYSIKFYWWNENTKTLATSWNLQVLRSINQALQMKPVEVIENDQVIDLTKTFVHKYSLEQLKKNIAALLPIASDIELKLVRRENKEVELDFLKRFFYNFWLARSYDNPEKAWNEYADKLNDVAKKYGTNTTLGFQTDRGRIYLKFGTPDKIETVMNEKDALPYEIWFYYNTQGRGNVKFLFAQAGLMNNEMFLIHSNQEDEIINPYWPQQLLTNSTGSDDKLKHRAYEYFNQ